MSIVLADDAALGDLNRQYRGIDRATDVLSFSMREVAPGVPSPAIPLALCPELGDVVISIETAGRQAAAHGVTLTEEVELLIVHGVLHLSGYDDETEAGAEQMREREIAVLTRGRHPLERHDALCA